MSNPYCEIIRAHSEPLAPIPTDATARLGKIPNVRAVLFDVYGTLFISSSGDIGVSAPLDPSHAVRASVEAAGAKWLKAAEVEKDFLERIIRARHDELIASGIEYPEVDIVEIWQTGIGQLETQGLIRDDAEIDLQRLAIEYEVRTNPVWPMPGLAECLERLAAAERVLGIVSNAQFYTPLLFPAFLDQTLEDLAFEPDMQCYSYRAAEAKPSEALYRQAAGALERRGLTASQALYIGNDMLKDIMPASKIGFRTALFAGDKRSLRLRQDDARVDGVQPDLVLTELASLSECLDLQ